MRIIRRTFSNLSKSTLLLGKEGEHLVTQLELDISKEISEFHDPVFELVLKTPAFDEPYPVLIQVIDDKLFYTFSGSDLAIRGFGELEALVCSPNGDVLKSTTAKTRIDPSIISNSYPGPLQKVIDHIYEIIEEEIEKHGIPVVTVLPETADVNTIVYLADSGFYRFTTEWERITKDDLESTVGTLSAFIDKLSEVGGELYYDGFPVGIPVYETWPINLPVGTIFYYNGSDAQHQRGLYLLAESQVGSNYTILIFPEGIWTEVSGLLQREHSHTNKPVIDKFSESAGVVLYDGQMIGVDVVNTPNDLSPSASDGATAAACFEIPAEHLVYPVQTGDEEVTIDYSGKSLTIGNPVYREAAIDALISDYESFPTATIETEDSEEQLLISVIPVVPDLESNDYTDAGVGIYEDGSIVDANSTSKYALYMDLTNSSSEFVNPDKIIQIDETHISAPVAAFYAFEPINGEIIGVTGQLSKGWNVLVATVELPSYEPTSISFVNGVNINEWIIYPHGLSGTLYVYGTQATNLLKGIYDVVSDGKEKGLYVHENGAWQHFGDVQDYTPLEFKEYSGLTVRDLARDDSIQDVPVYNTGATGAICKLLDANDNFVSLEEARQPNGDPVRFVKVSMSNTVYVFLPVPLDGTGPTIPAGWSSGGQTVDAPSLAGFTPVKMEVGETTYEDLMNIPRDVQLALGSLSQCINESADAMGHINIPDDAVIRYSGTIEPNRKYYFSTLQDFSLDLPYVPNDKTDAQFVIYLDVTTNDIDVSFPSGTFVAGEIDTTVGRHKIVGCRLRDVKEWAVGGLTYEEASS